MVIIVSVVTSSLIYFLISRNRPGPTTKTVFRRTRARASKVIIIRARRVFFGRAEDTRLASRRHAAVDNEKTVKMYSIKKSLKALHFYFIRRTPIISVRGGKQYICITETRF